MKKQSNRGPATKADVEEAVGELAAMTAKEFLRTDKKIDVLNERVDALNEKVDTGFTEVRQEIREGFRAVLAAVETVEYTKLRMRIDVLESDMKKVKEKVIT